MSHDKLYFVLEWLVSGVVGMLWNGGGLGTGESNVSIVLPRSFLHRSSSLSNVYLAAFTGNPVDYVDTKWAEFVTVYSDFPVKGDKMLAKWADKSYAKVFTHDTIGLSGALALWIFGKP